MTGIGHKSGKSRHFTLLLLLVSMALVFRIAHQETLSYWLDEGYTAWFADLSLRDIWFWLPSIEAHPPLYYSLVKLWGLVAGDASNLWHRSLSIVISLLLVVSGYFTTRKAARLLGQNGERAALFNSFLLCFTPVIVWYSLEARPYILMYLAYSLALLGIMYIYADSSGRKLKGWVLFSIGAALTNWSHHLGGLFSAMLYCALALHWMIDRRFDASFLLRLIGSALLVFLVSIPLALQIYRQLSLWSTSSWVAEPSLMNVAFALRRVMGFGFSDRYVDLAFGNLAIIHAVRVGVGLFTGLLSIALALYGFYRMMRARRYSFVAFFLLACFGMPILTIAISIIGPNIFIERILVPGLIPFCMLLALALGYLDNRALRIAIKGFYILFLSAGVYATFKAGEKEPWDKIVSHLSAEVGENDVVLLLPNDLYLPARLYVTDPHLAARIKSVPAPYPAVGYSDFYPDGFPAVPGIRPEDAEAVRALIDGKARVFLVTRLERLFDPLHVTRTLLEADYIEISGQEWGDIQLDVFERRPR